MSNNVKIFIEPLKLQLQKLKEFGFVEYKESKIDNDIVCRWERSSEWKMDVIQLTYFEENPNDCKIGRHVYLIVEGRDYILTTMSVLNSKCKTYEYQFPKLFKELKAKKFIDEVTDDLVKQIEWFNKFKNKHECLELIKKADPDDNIAIGTSGRIFPIIEKILSDEN